MPLSAEVGSSNLFSVNLGSPIQDLHRISGELSTLYSLGELAKNRCQTRRWYFISYRLAPLTCLAFSRVSIKPTLRSRSHCPQPGTQGCWPLLEAWGCCPIRQNRTQVFTRSVRGHSHKGHKSDDFRMSQYDLCWRNEESAPGSVLDKYLLILIIALARHDYDNVVILYICLKETKYKLWSSDIRTFLECVPVREPCEL